VVDCTLLASTGVPAPLRSSRSPRPPPYVDQTTRWYSTVISNRSCTLQSLQSQNGQYPYPVRLWRDPTLIATGATVLSTLPFLCAIIKPASQPRMTWLAYRWQASSQGSRHDEVQTVHSMKARISASHAPKPRRGSREAYWWAALVKMLSSDSEIISIILNGWLDLLHVDYWLDEMGLPRPRAGRCSWTAVQGWDTLKAGLRCWGINTKEEKAPNCVVFLLILKSVNNQLFLISSRCSFLPTKQAFRSPGVICTCRHIPVVPRRPPTSALLPPSRHQEKN